MSKSTEKQLPSEKLEQITVAIDGKDYTLTELNGYQRILLDVESKITDVDAKDHSAEANLAFYNFKCLAIALGLEASTGIGFRDGVESIKTLRLKTVNSLYDQFSPLIFGEEDPDPENPPG